MKRLKDSWVWILLFGAALAVGIAAGAPGTLDSPLPSVRNPGPRGAQVLHTYLSEAGAHLEPLDATVETIPAGVDALVIAAPTARQISDK